MEGNKLCNRLKRARLAQGLTIRDVEKLSVGQISDSHLSKIERGSIIPSPHHLSVIAKILKLPYMELMVRAGHVTIRDLKGKV